ncbi:MAG: protein kinase domain-containing protein [Kofleriaceae bacterium]
MSACLAEDDLFELANGGTLGDAPALEAHLADCAACSSLLSTLLASVRPAGRDLAGTTLGPYRLDGLIGSGAMGEVYRGWDQRLKRHVAVKVLAREESPERVRRLVAEGRAAAAIAHPNVVTIYDTGSEAGIPYIVTELLEGESLTSLIARGPIARATALDLGLQLARGLAAAHAQGVVHRDLKPSNLIVTGDRVLKILDFGLAKVIGEREGDATEPGTLLGTCGYLSPEQARGEPADARSDVFSVGAILYELVSGRRAFAGATFADRLSATLRDDPPRLGDPLDPILERCLAKDPKKRFQSANDLAWALEGRLEPSPAPRRGLSRRAFLLGTAATGIGGIALGRMLAPAAKAPSPIVPAYSQLTFRHGRVASARFTRDGGSLLYTAAWEGGPLTVYLARLGAGGTRALELPPARLLDVSSRGELAIALGHRWLEGFHQSGELAVVPLEGGVPRRLGVEVQHADFTPGGEHLAVVRRAGARFRLELPIGRTLLEAGWISHPRVSPDGAWIACLVHDSPLDDRGDLVLVPHAGGHARTIAGGWSSIDGLAWSASGRELWISASREGGNNGGWTIALDGGERALVPSAGRVRVHDLAPDGRLAVTHVTGRLRMLAKPPGATSEIDVALADVTAAADISGDGRQLVFAEFGDVDTANGAYVRPLGDPASRALRLGSVVPFDLADDGRGVLAGIGDPNALVIQPLVGQPRRFALPGLVNPRGARWLAGGVLVTAAVAGHRPRLWRWDLASSAVPLTAEGVFGDVAVSPDGHRVALITDGELVVIDAATAASSRVPGAFVDEVVCGWHTDNASVFVRGLTPPIPIQRVDVATGTRTRVAEIAPPSLGLGGVCAVVIDHAGDAYAYSYGQELSRLYVTTFSGG